MNIRRECPDDGGIVMCQVEGGNIVQAQTSHGTLIHQIQNNSSNCIVIHFQSAAIPATASRIQDSLITEEMSVVGTRVEDVTTEGETQTTSTSVKDTIHVIEDVIADSEISMEDIVTTDERTVLNNSVKAIVTEKEIFVAGTDIGNVATKEDMLDTGKSGEEKTTTGKDNCTENSSDNTLTYFEDKNIKTTVSKASKSMTTNNPSKALEDTTQYFNTDGSVVDCYKDHETLPQLNEIPLQETMDVISEIETIVGRNVTIGDEAQELSFQEVPGLEHKTIIADPKNPFAFSQNEEIRLIILSPGKRETKTTRIFSTKSVGDINDVNSSPQKGEDTKKTTVKSATSESGTPERQLDLNLFVSKDDKDIQQPNGQKLKQSQTKSPKASAVAVKNEPEKEDVQNEELSQTRTSNRSKLSEQKPGDNNFLASNLTLSKEDSYSPRPSSRKRKVNSKYSDYIHSFKGKRTKVKIETDVLQAKTKKPKKRIAHSIDAKTEVTQADSLNRGADFVGKIKVPDANLCFICHLCGFQLPYPQKVIQHVQRFHREIKETSDNRNNTGNSLMSPAAKLLLGEQCVDGDDLDKEDRRTYSSGNKMNCNDTTIEHSTLSSSGIASDIQRLSETNRGGDDGGRVSGLSKEVIAQFIQHHSKMVGNEQYECVVCTSRMKLSDHAEWLNHLAKHKLRPQWRTCLVCMQYFPENHLFKHHMHSVHGKLQKCGFPGVTAFVQDSHYCCHVCADSPSTNFKSVLQYEKHMLKKHAIHPVFPCEESDTCHFVASSLKGLAQHTCLVYAKDNIKRFKSEEDSLKQTCEFCDFCSTSKKAVEKHRENDCPSRHCNESGQKDEYPCDLCDQVFVSKQRLEAHNRSSHKGPARCPYKECGKLFKHGDTLRCHINKSHLNRWRYSCNVCGMTLADRSALQLHVKTVHENIRDIVCPWPQCEKKFMRKNALKVHYRLHTGEKRLLCEYCSYGAIQRTAMDNHMKRHHSEEHYDMKARKNSSLSLK